MMETNCEQLRDLLKALLLTKPEEIDCDVFLSSVGELLETMERRDEPQAELTMALQHLEICPECREEFEALLRANDLPLALFPTP